MDNKGLEDFIEIYKEHRCLWDTKSPRYSNKQLRIAALQELLIVFKKYDATANIASVRKKIDTLRTNYNRERKKVLESNRTVNSTGEIYRPNLWYYDRLSFLSEIEDSARVGIGSDPSRKLSVPRKKEKTTQKRLLGMVELLSQKPDDNDINDEYAAFGKMVGLEIKKLKNPEQSIAQKLISDVIFYSKLGKITIDSFISIPHATITTSFSSHQYSDPLHTSSSQTDSNTPFIITSPSPPLRTPTPNSTHFQFSSTFQNACFNSDLNPSIPHIPEIKNEMSPVQSPTSKSFIIHETNSNSSIALKSPSPPLRTHTPKSNYTQLSATLQKPPILHIPKTTTQTFRLQSSSSKSLKIRRTNSNSPIIITSPSLEFRTPTSKQNYNQLSEISKNTLMDHIPEPTKQTQCYLNPYSPNIVTSPSPPLGT